MDIHSNRFLYVKKGHKKTEHKFNIKNVTLVNITATDNSNNYDVKDIEGLKVKNVTLNGNKL